MSVVLHDLLKQAFTFGGLPCPQPTEEDPYAWENVPEEFGVARGIGGGTGYTMNARDAAFTISCKSTDAAHAFMHARRSQQQASRLSPGWSGDTIAHFRGDTGETWIGTGCFIEAAPAQVSTQAPQAVTWRIIVSNVVIQGPSLIPVAG